MLKVFFIPMNHVIFILVLEIIPTLLY